MLKIITSKMGIWRGAVILSPSANYCVHNVADRPSLTVSITVRTAYLSKDKFNATNQHWALTNKLGREPKEKTVGLTIRKRCSICSM